MIMYLDNPNESTKKYETKTENKFWSEFNKVIEYKTQKFTFLFTNNKYIETKI